MGYYGMGDYYRRGEVGALVRSGGALLKRAAPWLAKGAGAAATAGTIYEAFKGISGPSAAAAPTFAQQMAAQPLDTGGRRRYRHMNVCNVRALRRSLRRVSGFARVARKVMVFARPGKKTHFKLPRRRRK
jgi:hypothetical protein